MAPCSRPLAPKSPGRLRSLLVDPFPDVRRTVSEFDAPTFAECQEGYSTTVDQADLLEIDGDCSAFLMDGGTKDVHVVASNPPAEAQDHKIPFNHKSVDSAGHGGWALPRLPHCLRRQSVNAVNSKPNTTRKLLIEKAETGRAVTVGLRILRILRN